MESLTFCNRKLTKEEVVMGLGGSALVHIIIVSLAVMGPWASPRQTMKPPFCTVNLVSLQDIGGDGAAAKKGTTAENASGAMDQQAHKASSTSRAKGGPIVPIKRLRMDEPVKRTETELKKIEAPPTPKVAESSTNVASVEKRVDSLIPKTKTQPKPLPLPQVSKEEGSQQSSKETAPKHDGEASQGSQKGSKNELAGQAGNPDGSPDGHPKGTADGRAKGANPGPAGGSPTGAQIDSARAAYYAAIQRAIRRNWAIPEFLKTQHLEVHLVLVLRRDGKVLNVQFEKRSGQPLFDQSVESAVRKAEPLPPFPEVYTPAKEEIGLRFRPEDLS